MQRLGRISGRTLAGAVALAAAGVVTFAGAASAHGNNDHTTCSSLVVDLENYNEKVTNTVTVIVGGVTEVNNQTFGSSFQKTITVATDHQAPIAYEIKVQAGDDATGKNGWTFTTNDVIPVCPPPTSPPPTTPAPPTSPSPSPSSSTASPTPTSTPTSSPTPTASVKPTSAAPVVKPTTPAPKPTSSSPSLAFTGGGSDSGVIAGVGAAVVVLGGGLVFMTRRRKAARH
ncbi:LAETG motif-containing sortase-dependent surface protein [Kitasatospora sp. NBC_01266]|uniref:LAETG motif-containing sortase-dependent surface protein n=1 Tax=Kitasatospora sp. NBC_01266 TaxID=2903572 RepID=UPI002E35BD9D|nr:LAETG motif-containing sortase-dependent surface protein [Kitasatospora sp. NBC_01266]